MSYKNVIAGDFGLSLFLKPKLVRKCVEAIINETSLNVSVKTRIGIDYNKDEKFLDNFVHEVSESKINTYIIHARNGIIKGLSTKKFNNTL